MDPTTNMEHANAGNENYSYFVNLVRSLPDSRSLKVLDYGCGQGEIVRLLRAAGIEAYGVEVCYEASSWEDLYSSELFREGAIQMIPVGGEIPFSDGFFDVILSNQVLEHVRDKVPTMLRLKRVLKDDGFMRHHFPTRSAVRECHIGIPLVHRLPRNAWRYRYTLLLRKLGAGHFKAGRSPEEWTRHYLAWIDRFCCYDYTDGALRRELSKQFVVAHREVDYCRFRARNHPLLLWLLSISMLAPLFEALFRALAFSAIELRKR